MKAGFNISASSLMEGEARVAPSIDGGGNEGVIKQLRNSGVQYSLKFIGTVAVKTSMNELTAKCQEDVALSCIKLALGEAGLANSPNGYLNNELNSHIDQGASPNISNRQVDLNVSSKWVLLVESNVRRVHRFPINEISIVCPGRGELSAFFCFIAKATANSNGLRRCFVFDGGDETREVYDCITLAFELAFAELQHLNGSARTPCPSVRVSAGSAQASSPTILISDNAETNTLCPPSTSLNDRNSSGSGADGCGGSHGHPSTSSISSNTSSDLAVDGGLPIVHTRERSCSGRGDTCAEISEERYLTITEGLSDSVWFHHLMTRDEAERLLTNDGQFLVRQSPNTTQKQFVLSGRTHGNCEHICLIGPKGKISSERGKFRSIAELINFYVGSGEELSSQPNGQTKLRLRNAVCSEQRH